MSTEPVEEVKDDGPVRALTADDIPFLDEAEEDRWAVRSIRELNDEDPWS